MANVDDVAAYILLRHGRMDTWKLQKLAYYCQAWHLVWESRPLFRAQIQAWANGPVVPALYQRHRGTYELAKWPEGNASRLAEGEKSTVDAVLAFYGDKTGQWLSALTHDERPWRDARRGLAEGERGAREITLEAMAEYYGSL